MPIPLPQIEIDPSDRVLIIGTPGSGKSWLTRRVLLPRYAHRPVVLDPKERWEEPPRMEVPILETFKPGEDYQIIRLPEYDDREAPYLWDAQIQAAMRDEGGHTLIIDELTLITFADKFPASLGKAVRTGRDTKRGAFGVWMLTQQPAYIPTASYAMSNHKFIFMCEREDDIRRIGRETTREIEPYIRDLRKYDYVYYNRERGILIPVTAVGHRALSPEVSRH